MLLAKDLIFPGGFIPRGCCNLRTPSLIWLGPVSDSLVALSYLPILISLEMQFREPLYALAVYWLRVGQPSLRHAMTNRMEKCA
jgi:hypothetical protein